MTGPRWEGIEIKVILDHLSRFLERVQGIRIGLTSLISDKRTNTLTNLRLTKQQPGEGNSLCGRGRKATDVEYFFFIFSFGAVPLFCGGIAISNIFLIKV